MSTQVYYFSVIARCDDAKFDHTLISGVFDRLDCNNYVFQMECGASGNYHYQCYIHTKQRYRPETLRRMLLLEGVKSWGTKPCSTAGRVALQTYCMKTDTRILGPWGLKTIYTGADLAVMKNPYVWQSEIIAMIQCTPDDRTIVWIQNAAGNVGKSKLMKFCKYKGLSVRIPLGTATQIKSSVIEKGPQTCYMLDLPRVRGREERMTEIFSAIEEIKNGWIESAMYGKTAELMMMPPHVIVFSNDAPNLNLASADRWVVYNINSTGEKLSQMSQSINIGNLMTQRSV